MSEVTDRPTLEERYSRAIGASSLVLRERTQSSCDMLIAAGMVSDPLAISIYRLATEFDEARSNARRARRNHEETKREAKEAGKRGAKKAQTSLNDKAEGDAQTERGFILMRLKSLASTKEEFGRWVLERARECRFMPLGPVPTELAALRDWRDRERARAAIVGKMAGRVLDVLIDPLCIPCEGRTFTGGYDGKPVMVCRQCKKSPGRRYTKELGHTEEESRFCDFLLGRCERMLAEVELEMRLLLRP